MKKIILPGSILLALVIALTAVLLVFLPKGGNPGKEELDKETEEETEDALYLPFYRNESKVGYSAEVLGTAPRQTPEVGDGGLPAYPVYGTVLYGSGTDTNPEEKAALLAENALLCAGTATYDGMDEEGNLYLSGESLGRKLYKHTAAAGMYLGDVSDDEPALVKKITVQARRSGNHITGLYAPAGEVLKIEMSEEDLLRTGGVTVEIGQALSNGQANNIWAAREFNRMPVILNTMTVTSAVGYVGSFFGGPVYIKPVNAGTGFSVTISSGVAYSHFILGYTTEEEFSANAHSSAPYFDLEVWDDGVRFSGPEVYAAKFSYSELTDAARLWEKIASVSNRVPSGSADIGINFLFDCFVAAGAAVAFVGRNTVNCPLSWMSAALDYDSFVSSGAWGCIHEYNHHYQRFGFAPGDEVTNNAVSLVSYSLFTDISSARTLSGGLTDWNRYTDPSRVLKKTIEAAQNGAANSDLDAYANILHGFGQDAFLTATKLGNGGGGADVWLRALCEATHRDMTYYFTELLHQTVSESVLEEIAAKNYPMYVPVATVYQTGGSYQKDGERVDYETVRPFRINRGAATVLDFTQELVLPEGFSYRIKSLTSPRYGTLVESGQGVYTYTPDPAHESSGKMTLTVEITREDGAFAVEDKQLTLELRQGANDKVLERTVYTYSSENLYQSAEEAYGKGYAGYETVTVEDNVNPVQNGNTEIWVPNPSGNAVMEIRGKIYIERDGDYRLALRGRRSVALYTSSDGVTYSPAATLVNDVGDDKFHLEQENSYADFTLKAGEYLYFKAVLLVDRARAYIGVGWGRFEGNEVSVGYLTGAYRNAADPSEKFESENYYPRNYRETVSTLPETHPVVVETNYSPWKEGYEEGYFSIENLFDGDLTNFIHSDRTGITAENPFELTVDLGKTVSANVLTIYGEPTRKYQPKNFLLYGGTDLSDLKLLTEVTNAAVTNDNVTVTFSECELRYYKLVVTDTYAPGTKYIAMRGLELSLSFSGVLHSPYEEMFVCRGGWELENTLSTFGRLYRGEDASMEFSFTGRRFAVFSLFGEEYDGFEVYIDGEKVDDVSLYGNGERALSYLSPDLGEGTHVVTIKSKTAFNVDGIVLL